MSPIFTINFRREAHRREVAEVRRRAAGLGARVAYAGTLLVVLGLYGLNYHSLEQRTRLLEAGNARLRSAGTAAPSWKAQPGQLDQAEAVLVSRIRWRTRLERLAALLPADARLTSLEVNPENLSGSADQDRLVIAGVIDPRAGRDRMQGIMQLVSALHGDSLFAAQYRTIRLVESQTGGGAGTLAEFRIECRR